MAKKWNTNDAVTLRGIYPRLREKLRESKPKSEGDNLESAVLNAKLRDGYDLCMDELDKLTQEAGRAADNAEYIDPTKDN